jgi:hypothetical protein
MTGCFLIACQFAADAQKKAQAIQPSVSTYDTTSLEALFELHASTLQITSKKIMPSSINFEFILIVLQIAVCQAH